jgi:methionine aminotransferase
LAPEVFNNRISQDSPVCHLLTHSATKWLWPILEKPDHYLSVSSFYQAKRDVFLESLKGSRFTWQPSRGSYFQNLNYSAITNENDVELAKQLTREIGVASIPVSVFYHQKRDFKTLRFCFAKDDETLREAGRRLSAL